MIEWRTMANNDHDETQTERLRDKALLRALSTPPKPHLKGEGQGGQKPKGKREKS